MNIRQNDSIINTDLCQNFNKTNKNGGRESVENKNSQAVLGRVEKTMSIFPGCCIVLQVDRQFSQGDEIVVEPRHLSRTYGQSTWPPPQIVIVDKNGDINLNNNTSEIIPIYKNDHLCQIYPTIEFIEFRKISEVTPKLPSQLPSKPFSKEVQLDPQDKLEPDLRRAFVELHERYDQVFEPVIGRYNDKSGKVRFRINIGSAKPPTKKLQVPCYSKNNLDALQEKFDQLEAGGVFVRPEDYGIVVEHVSPSFLVQKANGGYRLVTAFTTLVQYCKTLPTTLPTVDSVLRIISSWTYIIVTDLRDAFYQIPMDRSSMKWCATPTPYRGLRCYAVAVQGCPGSSEALEELLCAVLGDLVKEGIVFKIADDLTVGAMSPTMLLHNWARVLQRLEENGLKLKGIKTIIFPTHTQILGWDWCLGEISASKHKLSPLITCELPKTVTALRSFIGAYKVFNRVIRQSSGYLSELDLLTSGSKQKQDKIIWSDHLIQVFKSAQNSLRKATKIRLPTPTDQLIITHDGSQLGIGSILFVKRDDSVKVGGYFSAKLKAHHTRWLPCEVEALSITASVTHFGPYLRESTKTTQVLTDSRPCVQAWNKMSRGQFSTSARVATFFSTLSQYNIEMQHLSGDMNLPSDFLSRNPSECDSRSCQICRFVDEVSELAVRKISVDEILSGRCAVPYANTSAWKNLQMECDDLRRVHAFLSSGTRPTAKKTKMTSVKRYLQNVSIGKDGLLIVRHSAPFRPVEDLIVVPQHVVLGLFMSLHLTLQHPTTSQLLQVFKRKYYCLRAQSLATTTTDNCSLCQSLRTVPKELHSQTTVDLPETPCRSFAADIVRRFKQKIHVIRDTFSSFTCAELVQDETHTTLRASLITLLSPLRPSPQTKVIVRVDNASGYKALREDLILTKVNITLDFGRVHNKDKNPVVDKGISELISEMLRQQPEGGQINNIDLALAVNQLNARIRGRGLSSWEILTQRDTVSGQQLDIDDNILLQQQTNTRLENQASSAKYKARGGALAMPASVSVGSLVYIKTDGSKTRARERYLVVRIVGNNCILKKLLSSSLRNKEYTLKLTEVYPVLPNTLQSDNYKKGLDSSSEDEIEEIDMPARPNLAVSNVTPTTGDRYNDPTDVVDSNEACVMPSAVDVSASFETPDVEQSIPHPTSSEDISVVNPGAVLVTGTQVGSEDLLGRPRRSRRRPEKYSDYDMS